MTRPDDPPPPVPPPPPPPAPGGASAPSTGGSTPVGPGPSTTPAGAPPSTGTADATPPRPSSVREPLDDRERGLDPRIVQVWRVGNAFGALFPLGPPAVLGPLLLGRWGWAITAAAVALFVAWVAWWPRAQFRRWHWRLTDLAIELRHGVVVHRHQAVPYFRIQQIDVAQGPLDRLLGLATLQVTTASASGSAALPGIPAADAPDVRIDLLARAAAAVGEHEGELRDAV